MKKIWEMLSANALLKIIAFCFACLIYVLLYDGSNATTTLPHVPITFNVPDTLYFSGGNYEVSLKVKGPHKEIEKLRERRIVGEIKLSPDLKTARHEISLDSADFKIPELEIVKISPASLIVPIQRRITKNLTVKPAISGSPADGYRVGEVSAFPDKVEITGPELAIDGLSDVKTADVSVKGENSDFGKENVDLTFSGKGVVVKPKSVSVNVQIRKLLTRNRIFTGIPIRYLYAANEKSGKNGMVFSNPEPQSAQIEVSGPERRVSRLAAEDFLLFVNLSAMKSEIPGEAVFPIEYRALRDFSDVRIIRIVPDKVKIKYSKKEGFLWNH